MLLATGLAYLSLSLDSAEPLLLVPAPLRFRVPLSSAVSSSRSRAAAAAAPASGDCALGSVGRVGSAPPGLAALVLPAAPAAPAAAPSTLSFTAAALDVPTVQR